MTSWIGVDLDGTLAEYDGWKGIDHIGPPKEWVREYVLQLLDYGVEVRVMTARVQEGQEAIDAIEGWCNVFLGQILPVTDKKDMDMVALIDDRAYGPKTWHQVPEAWEFAAMTKWHNDPNNSNSPASVDQADGASHDATV